MIFFVRPLKYANFHGENYPSCVTSCDLGLRARAVLLL